MDGRPVDGGASGAGGLVDGPLSVDFDSTGPIEAEYDFRYLPSQAPGIDLFTATVRHHQREPGHLDLPRFMAWHIRTVLDLPAWLIVDTWVREQDTPSSRGPWSEIVARISL